MAVFKRCVPRSQYHKKSGRHPSTQVARYHKFLGRKLVIRLGISSFQSGMAIPKLRKLRKSWRLVKDQGVYWEPNFVAAQERKRPWWIVKSSNGLTLWSQLAVFEIVS